MDIIPAIDFKDGKVVNLRQGRLEESTVYSDDPVGMADYWVKQGARRLHLVDLDGAFEGYPVNHALIAMIAANHPQLTIQLGGGIRSPEVIESYLNAGVDYVIIGTKAVEEPEFVGAMCQRFSGHIMVGLDGLHGMVAKNGWKEVTDISVKSLALLFESDGIESIIYTDIGKDGMMGVSICERPRILQSPSLYLLSPQAVSLTCGIFWRCWKSVRKLMVVSPA